MVSRNKKFRAARWTRPIASVVIAGIVASNAQTAVATPQNPSNEAIRFAEDNALQADNVLQALVAEVTAKERRVGDLELSIGKVREDVNKAMVDLEQARANAQRARAAVDQARKMLEDSRIALRHAQSDFDQLAKSIMRNGYSAPSVFAGAENASDALNKAAELRRRAAQQQNTVNDLDKSRTASANNEAKLRTASAEADQAEASANSRKQDAEAAYNNANRELETEQADYQRARADREAARKSLEAARDAVNGLHTQRQQYENDQARKEAENEAARKAAEAASAASREQRQSATSGATANNTTSENSSSSTSSTESSANPQSAATSSESTGRPGSSASTGSSDSSASTGSSGSSASTGRSESTTNSTGSSAGSSDTDLNGAGTDSAADSNAAESDGTATTTGSASSNSSGSTVKTKTPSNPESVASSASRSTKIEAVITRAKSALGSPYAWGGGDANGPTKGIRDGGVADAHGDYNKVGFDCSGLTIYAYAAVGISLPHYTGYQYQKGTHYPVSQMQRGDLIFYGPNGHGHVAIYLGDGTMIEAPQSGDVVKISPVRYNGITPNVVRLL